MSPDAKAGFETEWAVLSRRLRLLLARKRVPPAHHDDLVQETALRLVSMWDSVDRRRGLWPLTVTIALNLLRDRGRAVNKDDLVAEIPDLAALTDVETVGIARMELRKVREAMDHLSESHRSILMKEIGAHAAAALPDGAGDKMLRMRARRKLQSALERVSALVALRVRRVADLFEGLLVVREPGITAASCALCLALGAAGAMLAPSPLLPQASAGSIPARPGIEPPLVTGGSIELVGVSTEPRQALIEERAAAERSAQQEVAGRGKGAGRRAKGNRGKHGSAFDPLDTLPLGDGDNVPDPTSSISFDASGDEPQPLSGGDGDEATTVPPVPPPPPPPGDSGDDQLGADELAEQLL